MVTEGEQSFILFSYGDIQWGDGSFIGFISPNTKFSFPGPLRRPQPVQGIETASNVGVPGLYAYRVDQDSIIDPNSRFKGKLRIHL